MLPPTARTIDEVIGALDAIIVRALKDGSRMGYFAALYRRVTRGVKDGIAAGRFEDGPRMARLDVNFANRYLDALAAFESGRPVTRSWQVAFQAVTEHAPLVLQHLLAGMNAHINLDLGIAAAVTCPGDQLPPLHTDFNRINDVLSELVGTVEKEMAAISPVLAMLEKIGLRTETAIVNFSMTKARDFAWFQARNLAALPESARDAAIGMLDLKVELLGRALVHPPLKLRLQLIPIRAVENDDIRRNVQILAA
ncbi:MAG: hypothetical protein EXQ52_16175 [Bryobacterales bacterium]|nr:hypothetical protein [Bryobacterales bacterium]